ncbi:hypothetical protein IQ244_27035 [Nostoc sp. LEGE 06077]|uniref:hypothetical protein n=1 Tax=Nostoc sp. LEGE 06077 TaxID=915325 RepID=UPI00187E7CEA|nr:hypothetical protein [Nostoc sp. LEGE 06077]MBE9210085.1 hypothetical protein [Nostoc sp. LEGE 06077]
MQSLILPIRIVTIDSWSRVYRLELLNLDKAVIDTVIIDGYCVYPNEFFPRFMNTAMSFYPNELILMGLGR